ncbi:hypothetical protein CLV97_1191 [Planifilum fimeticola]|uniref:Uncharacterized protein n=1 Tax=Planifilum fimeticola TaxID=201975 RepID=A0A2T0LCS4_9BACL|nr:hypothetical protein CLV97_1191 [Planifilum fimeticola]
MNGRAFHFRFPFLLIRIMFQVLGEWIIIRIVKNILLVAYYFAAVYLSLEVINKWIINIQEYLTREPSFQTWAPTGLSYTILTMTVLFIVVGIFGWVHLLLAKNDLKEMIPGKIVAVILAYGSILVLFLGLLLTPLAIDHYVAADEDAFYYDPYFGFEPEVFPWEEAQVILGYQYLRSQEIGMNYIIKTDENEYDLWKSMLNTTHSEEQFQMIKDVDRIVREKGVPVTIRQKIGPQELELMVTSVHFTPEEIEFVKNIFGVEF